MTVTRPLKLALLSVHSCPVGNLGGKDTGGMNVYVREIAWQLGKQGHSVDVFTRSHDPEEEPVVELGENARLVHLRAGEIGDIDKLALYAYLDEFSCEVENFRRKNEICYDLIFSHYWLSGWVGRTLQTWWQVPQMIMFHTLGAIKNALDIGEDESELRIKTEGDLIRECQRIVVATEREKNLIDLHYGAWSEKIAVIPCGVDLRLFKPVRRNEARKQLGLDEKDRIVLFVGRIERLKGIDILLEAVARLRDVSDMKVLIVGGDTHSDDETERLRRLCHNLQIEDRVTFRGSVEQERLPYFYSAADVCVIPSHYESFCLVALESLACGTPVVTSKNVGMENIINQGKTGFVMDENTPDQLADNIELLLARSGEGESNSSIRASVARFDWSSIARLVAGECNAAICQHLARVS